jgi:membrane protein involved in colicin uptake
MPTRGKKGHYVRRIIFCVLLILSGVFPAWAQDASAVELQVQRLRDQLGDVAEKEAQLRERARQLDEELRPENVERSVAAIGTTDARAVREQRRQQLERQKAAVDEQLTSLAASRARLEAAVASAEAEVVRLRAAALGANDATPRAGPTAAVTRPTAEPPVKKRNVSPRKSKPRRRNRPRRRA